MFGLDLLGLGHRKFNISHAIQGTPAGFAIGVFDEVFGNVVPRLKRMLRTGKYPAIRVHLWWSTAHKICPLSVIKERAPVYEKLKKEFPAVLVYISHSCEYNEARISEVRARVEALEKYAPSCIPVNACWKGVVTPGVISEKHGSKVSVGSGNIASTDGESAFDIDIIDWNQRNIHAKIRFLWGLRFNLRENPDPGQVVPPPKKRTAAPSLEYIKSVAALAATKGVPPDPQFSGDIRAIKRPSLYKTHAEDMQGIDDRRENRPVLIVPAKAPRLEIVNRAGQHLGDLVYGGTMERLHRYYAGSRGGIGKYGYQIGDWIWFRAPGTKQYFGPVHAAFRTGYFR